MKKQLSFSQYRAIDLSLTALMLIVFEFIVVKAATAWFPFQPFTVSVVAAVTAIAMMRWGAWSAIHAVLGGAVFCFCSGAEPKHYLIYCVGNLLSMLSLLLIRFIGSEKIRTSAVNSMILAFTVQALMLIGRAGMALATGHTFGNALGFITTDALSIIFTMVIIWIVRNLDGMFENQKSYLLRVQKEMEREKERGENLE